MKLLEVIVTRRAAPEVLATGLALGKRLRKITVPAGVCDGFIGNRIMSALPAGGGFHAGGRRAPA
jgi:3-hydroxyacyl-CoA dehydrogenase